jgi:hypothetical protein
LIENPKSSENYGFGLLALSILLRVSIVSPLGSRVPVILSNFKTRVLLAVAAATPANATLIALKLVEAPAASNIAPAPTQDTLMAKSPAILIMAKAWAWFFGAPPGRLDARSTAKAVGTGCVKDWPTAQPTAMVGILFFGTRKDAKKFWKRNTFWEGCWGPLYRRREMQGRHWLHAPGD